MVISQLTALSGVKSVRRFDKVFALTNRLRIEGTDHLLAAAKAAGARSVQTRALTDSNAISEA